MAKGITFDPIIMQAAALGGQLTAHCRQEAGLKLITPQELQWQKLSLLVLSLCRLQLWGASLLLIAGGKQTWA